MQKRNESSISELENTLGWSEYESYDQYDYDYDEEVDQDELLPDSNADSEFNQEDLVSNLPRQIYCDLVNTLNDKCLVNSLLEIWKYDERIVKQLTQQDILNAINKVTERYNLSADFQKKKKKDRPFLKIIRSVK